MKLKVIVKEFFDKKEQKYVRQEKEPVIEREEERARQLIAAGVCEELVEDPGKSDETTPEIPTKPTDETLEEAMPEPEEEEAPKPKKKK